MLVCVENAWGPQVVNCGDNFDFTLLFEEVALFTAPLCAVGILAAVRIWLLWKSPVVAASVILERVKYVGASVRTRNGTASVADFVF